MQNSSTACRQAAQSAGEDDGDMQRLQEQLRRMNGGPRPAGTERSAEAGQGSKGQGQGGRGRGDHPGSIKQVLRRVDGQAGQDSRGKDRTVRAKVRTARDKVRTARWPGLDEDFMNCARGQGQSRGQKRRRQRLDRGRRPGQRRAEHGPSGPGQRPGPAGARRKGGSGGERARIPARAAQESARWRAARHPAPQLHRRRQCRSTASAA